MDLDRWLDLDQLQAEGHERTLYLACFSPWLVLSMRFMDAQRWSDPELSRAFQGLPGGDGGSHLESRI